MQINTRNSQLQAYIQYRNALIGQVAYLLRLERRFKLTTYGLATSTTVSTFSNYKEEEEWYLLWRNRGYRRERKRERYVKKNPVIHSADRSSIYKGTPRGFSTRHITSHCQRSITLTQLNLNSLCALKMVFYFLNSLVNFISQ